MLGEEDPEKKDLVGRALPWEMLCYEWDSHFLFVSFFLWGRGRSSSNQGVCAGWSRAGCSLELLNQSNMCSGDLLCNPSTVFWLSLQQSQRQSQVLVRMKTSHRHQHWIRWTQLTPQSWHQRLVHSMGQSTKLNCTSADMSGGLCVIPTNI